MALTTIFTYPVLSTNFPALWAVEVPAERERWLLILLPDSFLILQHAYRQIFLGCFLKFNQFFSAFSMGIASRLKLLQKIMAFLRYWSKLLLNSMSYENAAYREKIRQPLQIWKLSSSKGRKKMPNREYYRKKLMNCLTRIPTRK